MPFPSETLRAWCENVQELIDAPREDRCSYTDGLCQCEVDTAIMYAPQDQRAQLASGLFWSVWIDQVLWDVLGGQGAALYDDFASRCPFPKLYSHPTPGYASPYFIISRDRQYPIPTRELLLEDKQEFWGEIAQWLTNEADVLVTQMAEQTFRLDLEERFGPEFAYLFEEQNE